MTASREPLKKLERSYSMTSLSKEFAESTSMHGLKFIAQDKASLPERILWVALFIVGLFFAMFFSWNLWENWRLSPILITIQTANYPITNYPFPTVTVCSVNKVSTKALGDWMDGTEEAKFFKLDEIRRILAIMSTGRVENNDEIAILSELLLRANITSNDGKYERLIDSISPNCSNMLIYCSWEDKEEECSKLFETEATDDGYCCSFNSIVLRRNSSYSGPKKQLKHARDSGVYAGLTILLDAEVWDYNVTSSSITGFKVSIQSPDDFARTGKIGFLASPGTQIDAAVTGQTQIGNDKLRAINLDKRFCTTTGEITLQYFNNYTGPYCQLDCLTRLFLQDCKCVPFYYPVPDELPTCNLSSYPCLQRVSDYVVRNTSACYCPDVCTTVWYRNEISSGTFPNSVSVYPSTVLNDRDFRNLNSRELNAYAKDNLIKLNVYFKTVYGMCFIMNERTTWTDFISATGGLLGLGFGFSIISAAELLYFFLIRWCYYWYESKKQRIIRVRPSVSVRPSYPLIPAHLNSDAVNLRSDEKPNRVNFAAKLPSTYRATWDRHQQTTWDFLDRPNFIRSWVDY